MIVAVVKVGEGRLGKDEKYLRHGCMGMVLGNTWLEVREDLGVQLEGQLSSGRGGGTVGLMGVDVMRGLNMGVGNGERIIGHGGYLGCSGRPGVRLEGQLSPGRGGGT